MELSLYSLREKALKGEKLTDDELRAAVKILRKDRVLHFTQKVEKERKVAAKKKEQLDRSKEKLMTLDLWNSLT